MVHRDVQVRRVRQLAEAVVVAVLQHVIPGEVIYLALREEPLLESGHVDDGAAGPPGGAAADLHVYLAKDGHAAVVTAGGERGDPLDGAQVSKDQPWVGERGGRWWVLWWLVTHQ